MKRLDSPSSSTGRGGFAGGGVRPASALRDLPPVWPAPLLDSIRGRRSETNRCLIVLDDDPMSGQALYDVPVLTTWNVNALAAEMSHNDVIVLLTDTRSLDSLNALARMREVGTVLREASAMCGRDVDVAMRGDSTLRGHFPADMDALILVVAPEGKPEACARVRAVLRRGRPGDRGRHAVRGRRRDAAAGGRNGVRARPDVRLCRVSPALVAEGTDEGPCSGQPGRERELRRPARRRTCSRGGETAVGRTRPLRDRERVGRPRPGSARRRASRGRV